MIASLGLAALLSGWLQRAITEPILEVARVAREVITQRDYSLRARKTTDDEIGELVDSFNALLAETGRRAEALREADRRKDEFLATLAHELRNPLAPLRNALEILRMPESNPAMREQARQMTERQLAQMVRLVRSLERAQAGLGVGLTLSRQLVTLHGGTLSVKSDGPGKGSEFTVRLPMAGASLGQSVERGRHGQSGQRRRILLADDNSDFASSLAAVLEARGHEVRVAHDGAEALAAAAGFNPDFAFLDIGMPKVHGYEVARRLRDMPATSECVLVAVTGWGQEDDRRRAREAGFDRHLVKPVDPA